MKKSIPLFCCALALALPVSAFGQSAAKPDAQQVLALVKEVQLQQAAIAANQTKLDEKLATLAETIRVARIYSSRGGR